MATQTVVPPTPEEHAKRFRETHQGKGLSDKEIDDICASILRSKPKLTESRADYYKMNIMSFVFYLNITVNMRTYSSPPDLSKHFVGNAGGWATPGDSFFQAAELYACDGYTFNDIFTKQTAFEVDSEYIVCFVRFYDKDRHLLGWLWGAGAGTVVGIASGTGEWKDGWLS